MASSYDNDLLLRLFELRDKVKKLEEENQRLSRLSEKADAANKAKSDFLAMISHEIRTPMNGVIGLAELLADTDLDSKQKNFAKLILSSGRNLLTLINSLLDFSKIEANMMELEIEEFDLKALIRELMNLYSVAGQKKNIKVFSEVGSTVAERYFGDSYRIRQILVNLLGNAVKFTDAGEVVLRINLQEPQTGRDLLHFSVHDSGPGIPSDKLDRLFKPFSQVDSSSTRKFGGTGLGLSICQKLVELMEGDIGVDSSPETGSDFWFRIPLGLPGKKEKKARTIQKNPRAGNPETLNRDGKLKNVPVLQALIVEDDETNRFVLETILQNSGIRITIARNGQEAVDLCRSNNFDLIFMDCQMPVMDGFKATEKIIADTCKSAGNKPIIIALTADATHSTRQRCREVGMDDYLLKPLELKKLQRTFDNWLPGSGVKIVSGKSSIVSSAEGTERQLAGTPVSLDARVFQKLQENMGDVRPVIRVFLDSLPERLNGLEKAIHEAENETIRRIAHTIKGSSSQFGAALLADLCERMEKAAKNNQLEYAWDLYGDIKLASAEIVAFLTEQLD